LHQGNLLTRRTHLEGGLILTDIQYNMSLLSKNNHFRFGYGPNFHSLPDHSNKWNVEYGKCNSSGSFLDECLNVANDISQVASKEIRVLFSGGIDSEVVCRSLQRLGVRFKASILQFEDNHNIHDISHAIVSCQDMGIEYEIYRIDITKFWGSKHFWELAELTWSVSPQFITTMWLLDSTSQYFNIIGSGECYLVRSDAPLNELPWSKYNIIHDNEMRGEWNLWEKESVASLYRYFLFRGIDGAPGFFQYSPEIMRAFLAEPLTQAFLNNPDSPPSTVRLKLPLYSMHFNLRLRDKFTGFEKLGELDEKYRSMLLKKFSQNNAAYLTSIGKLQQQFNL
jgi:hypothetical protein